MMRVCPKCKEPAVKVKLLSFSSRMHCDTCFHQYQYTRFSKWTLRLILVFIPVLAALIGLGLMSILAFAIVLIGLPFLIEFIFAKYCPLEPVGLRALREKISNKSP